MPEFRFQRTLLTATLGMGVCLMMALPVSANHHFYHGPPSPPTPPPAPPVHHHPPTPPTTRPPTPPTQQILERQRMQNAVRSRQSLGAATMGSSFTAIDDKVGDWSDFANLSEAELATLFAEMMPENDGFNGAMVKGMLTQQIQMSDAPPDVQRQMLAGVDQMVAQMGTMVGMSMASFPQDMAREFKQIYAANCCGQAQFIAALGAAETKVANKIRADFARGMTLPPGLPPGMSTAIAGNIAGGTTVITYSANDAEVRAAAAMVANGRPGVGGGTQIAGLPGGNGGGGSSNAPPIPPNSVGGSTVTGGTPQVNNPPPGGNTPPPANTPQTPPPGGGQTGGGNVQLPPPNIPTTSVGGTGPTGGTPQIPTAPPGGNTPPPGGNTPPPGGITPPPGGIAPPPGGITPPPGGNLPPGNPPNLSDLVPPVPNIPPVNLLPPGEEQTPDTPPLDPSGLLGLTPDNDPIDPGDLPDVLDTTTQVPDTPEGEETVGPDEVTTFELPEKAPPPCTTPACIQAELDQLRIEREVLDFERKMEPFIQTLDTLGNIGTAVGGIGCATLTPACAAMPIGIAFKGLKVLITGARDSKVAGMQGADQLGKLGVFVSSSAEGAAIEVVKEGLGQGVSKLAGGIVGGEAMETFAGGTFDATVGGIIDAGADVVEGELNLQQLPGDVSRVYTGGGF